MEKNGTVIAKCKDCRAVARNARWSEGTQCPECGSANFFPVPIVGGAVSYTLADRSRGPAVEDKRLVQLAKWSKLITQQQSYEALMSQKRYVDENQGDEAPPVEKILLESGNITEEEAAALLQVLAKRAPSQDDEEFGAIALQKRLLDRDQLSACRKIQAEAARDGDDCPPICYLLLEKGHLQETHVRTILQTQYERERGLLYELKVALAALERQRIAGKKRSAGAIPGMGAGKVPVGRLLLVVVLLAVAAYIWLGPKGGGGLRLDLKCKSCEAIYETEWTTTFPQKCKKCGANAAYYVVKCAQCGELLIWDSPMKPGKKCPKCGSDKFQNPI